MEIKVHHGITDLYRTLGLSFENDIDFTILSIPDIHPHIPFESPKLRADYFSFILTKDGSGVYYLDDNKFPFLLAEIVPPQKMSENDFEEFEILYKQIFREFNKDSEYKNKILGNLFMVLLLKIKEKFWSNYNPIEEGNKYSQIVKSFKQLLESEFSKVMDNDQNDSKLLALNFAERLNMHPNYLNAVIKSKTGRTVNDWISKRTLSVAKSLLMNTSLSSKEIAFKLGFSEPTHFSRFFKKHTHLSPGTFRKPNKS